MTTAVGELIDLVRRAHFDHPNFVALQNAVRERAVELSQKPREARTEVEEIEYLKCLCIISEIYDYLGKYEDASAIIAAEYPTASASLRQRKTLRSDQKRLFKQTVWLVVHQAHVEYRNSRYAAASQLLGDCGDALDRLLPVDEEEKQTEGQPAYDIRSRVAYSQARIARQLQKMEEARGLYAAAIEFQYRRLEAIARSDKTQVEKDREQAYSNYMVAKAFGLGLGWISLKSGQLKRAHATIAAARALIHTTGDPILKGYTDLLFAQALRAEAGTNALALSEPIRILTRLVNGPLKNHDQYRTRAQIELARAYHLLSCSPQMRDTESGVQALQLAKETLEHLQAAAWAHPSWTTFAKVLMSRIRCSEARAEKQKSRQSDLFAEAVREATGAFQEALKTGERAFQVKSLMAQADALMQKDRVEKDEASLLLAEEKLRQALESAGESPLDRAVCHLDLARLALRRGFPALEHFHNNHRG